MTNRRTLLKSALALGAGAPLISNASPPKAVNATSTKAAAVEAIRRKVSAADTFPSPFNPMAGNPLKTRSDVVAAMRDLYLPLTPFYSKGGARVRLDMSAAVFDHTAADMEGFARPLWGLAPLAAGGGADFVDWDLFRRGLANGTNPDHPEFWGWTSGANQRLVELASIGFALTQIRHILWEPQTPAAKKNIAHYLQKLYAETYVENNWMFFRLMVGLGLKAIGQPIDESLIKAHESKIDSLYIDNGWYRDGNYRRADYYVPFAFHFYGLLYSRLGKDAERTKLLQERAKAITPEFIRWFADDGASIPFGRSMTYRFACGAFWSAMAFADTPMLPWGQIKGLVLRHLRFWSKLPIADRDGILSIGYGYPNMHFYESYNSTNSPYWAFKMFAFMALPETHPFWTSKEEALPVSTMPSTQSAPGMIVFNPPGDAIALSSGQEENEKWLRLAPEKYSKFAYSARYGFSVETDYRQFDAACLDNMLGFSEDGFHFRVRERNQVVKIAENLLYALWSPEAGVTVETWLTSASPWHVRVHRINASKPYQIIEGGFGSPRDDGPVGTEGTGSDGFGMLFNKTDFTGVRDLGSSVTRTGRVLASLANTNLIYPKTSIPQLLGKIPAGETILMTAVLALADPVAAQEAWAKPPTAPKIAELEAIIRSKGVNVKVAKLIKK